MASCSRVGHGLPFAEKIDSMLTHYFSTNDAVANMANASAVIYHCFNERKPNSINWAGFYVVKGGESLTLGPFQGKAAVVTIPFTKGMCGRCATTKQTVVIDDVHSEPEHIACDSASNSEIVVPMFDPLTGNLVAVLDIDSPLVGNFSAKEDIDLLQSIAARVSKSSVWKTE